jgi:chorismate mutase
MSKILRGIRGAVTARANTSEAILEATTELLRALQEENGFALEDVESAIFTSTPDLTADFPARAARASLGWLDVPLLGAVEVDVPNGMPLCIRVLLHVYTTRSRAQLKHTYLGDAVSLRPDRPPSPDRKRK